MMDADRLPMAGLLARTGALHRHWPIMLGYLAITLALPFAVAGVFPSQDGPAHVNTAGLLDMLRAGNAPVADVFLLAIDPGFTNVIAPSLLSLLMRVMTAQAAEWTIALLLTFMLAAAVIVSLRLVGGGAENVGLGVLLCVPLMLYMGSFSLVMALAAGFVALACAAAFVTTGRPSRLAIFAGAAIAACIANIQVAAPLVAAILGGSAGAVGWRVLRGGGFSIPRRFIALGTAVLPVIALAVAYKARIPEGHVADAASWDPIRQAGVLLLRGEIAWFWIGDAVLLGLTMALLGLCVLWWLVHALRVESAAAPASQLAQEWLLWAAIALFAVAMILPMHTDAVPQITHRIAPFAQLLLLLWFATATMLPQRLRSAVIAVALLASLGSATARTLGHAAMGERVAELSWAEAAVPSNSVVAMLHLPAAIGWFKSPSLAHGGIMLRFDPLATFGRGLDGKDVVDLSNYQFRPYFNIFRLQFRPELDVAAPELQALWIAVRDGTLRGRFGEARARLVAATGHDIDTLVIMTGGHDQAEIARDHPSFADFRQAVMTDYVLVGRSAPAGYVELWRRR